MYNDPNAFKLPRHMEIPGGVNIEQISGNKTLNYSDSQYQRLDAQTGSLEVILPEERDGAFFVINCQGQGFTVKDAAGNTVKGLSVGEGCLVCCDGSSWKQFL
tara:strand:+ start:260 stop:568 length:309 start_codon:yes stop_codon:yes gene_type:complete